MTDNTASNIEEQFNNTIESQIFENIAKSLNETNTSFVEYQQKHNKLSS